jgi:hypothetical protein
MTSGTKICRKAAGSLPGSNGLASAKARKIMAEIERATVSTTTSATRIVSVMMTAKTRTWMRRIWSKTSETMS